MKSLVFLFLLSFQPIFACEVLFEDQDFIVGFGRPLESEVYEADSTVVNIKQKPLNEINRNFNLSADTSLEFAVPLEEDLDLRSKDDLGGYNVKIDVYHYAMVRGIVYISNRHDFRDHLLGFIRLSKTKAWKLAMRTFGEFLQIRDNYKNSYGAGGAVTSLASVIESATFSITLADKNSEHVRLLVSNFSSEVNRYVEELAGIKKLINNEKKLSQRRQPASVSLCDLVFEQSIGADIFVQRDTTLIFICLSRCRHEVAF